jgi:hypothetical protein
MTALTFIMSCLCSLATFRSPTQAELYLPVIIMSCVSSLDTFPPPTQAELYLPFLSLLIVCLCDVIEIEKILCLSRNE